MPAEEDWPDFLPVADTAETETETQDETHHVLSAGFRYCAGCEELAHWCALDGLCADCHAPGTPAIGGGIPRETVIQAIAETEEVTQWHKHT